MRMDKNKRQYLFLQLGFQRLQDKNKYTVKYKVYQLQKVKPLVKISWQQFSVFSFPFVAAGIKTALKLHSVSVGDKKTLLFAQPYFL